MKNILIVVHTLQPGGAEKVLMNLLKNIDKQKYFITILAIVDDGIYREELKKMQNVRYQYIFRSFFKKSRENKESKWNKISNRLMDWIWKLYILNIKYFSKNIYKKHIKEKYDIEIAFLEGKVAKLVSQSTNQNSKKIVWIHTDINNVNGINIFKSLEEERECYKRFNKIVCVSSDVKRRFIEKVKIEENLYVQLNPIDSIDIINKAEESIQQQLKRKGLIISSVGRLVKEKGYDRLLIAHKRLIEEGIIHTLWIIGEGKERSKLEEYIKRNHLEETVELIGFTINPYQYVKNSDIFVCSSRIEGLSSAVIEATILKKPIVSTLCPGIRDILGENGESAILVENSINGIYEGLKRILTDKKVRDDYEKKIQLRSNQFNIKKVVLDIEKILDD